jgi:acyl-coenzyme A synthetase/AMP-(fatty) acid ligase
MSPIDGSIIYLGRLDAQIKIRGLRVEPGEIEEVLKASNAAVVNAVIVKVDIGHEVLIASIECHSSTRNLDIAIIRDDSLVPLSASLRQAVHQKLPTYMAPATYVFLNRFPVTTSGKLDRNELHAFFVSHEKEIRDSERRLENHATVQKKRTASARDQRGHRHR